MFFSKEQYNIKKFHGNKSGATRESYIYWDDKDIDVFGHTTTILPFENLAFYLWGRHTSTPIVFHELLGFQEQPQDHNLYILDLRMGHFGADTQAQQFCYMNYWASKSNHRTTIYVYWI